MRVLTHSSNEFVGLLICGVRRSFTENIYGNGILVCGAAHLQHIEKFCRFILQRVFELIHGSRQILEREHHGQLNGHERTVLDQLLV